MPEHSRSRFGNHPLLHMMEIATCDLIEPIKGNSKNFAEPENFTGVNWILLSKVPSSPKTIFLFSSNGDIVVVEANMVQSGTWKYLCDSSIFLEIKSEKFLLTKGFIDGHIFMLHINGSAGFIVLVCEEKYDFGINTVDKVSQCLSEKYQKPANKKEENLSDHTNKSSKSNINLSPYFIIDYNKVKRKKYIYKAIIMFNDTTCGALYINRRSKRVYFLGKRIFGVFRVKYYFDKFSDCLLPFYKHLKKENF